MTKEIKDLLAVLDMPEDEHARWCSSNVDCVFYGCLADLAFRLRDEVFPTEFHAGVYEVQQYETKDYAPALWGECFAQPIHWIIAALIAKSLAKEDNNENM